MGFIYFLILLALGYGFGRYAEKKHYKSIMERERIFRGKMLLIPSKHPPVEFGPQNSQLVSGSVVISVDYFKRLLAALRNFFGGRVKSYETLLDRARREAILRMQQQAKELGANTVLNIKLETASISKGRKDTVGSVEVLAYGTAMIPR